MQEMWFWFLRFRRSPGEGNGNPLQYSCLRNPIDRGAWQTTVHGVTRVGYNLVTKLSHYIINHQMHMACRKIILKIGKEKKIHRTRIHLPKDCKPATWENILLESPLLGEFRFIISAHDWRLCLHRWMPNTFYAPLLDFHKLHPSHRNVQCIMWEYMHLRLILHNPSLPHFWDNFQHIININIL